MSRAQIPEKIVIHCSASPQGRGTTAATIHNWHTEAPRNWSGIGYHYVIREEGTVENGRPDYWEGAHARGANRNSLGICLIGMDSFTDRQFLALKLLIADKMVEYKIKLENVVGHYEIEGSGKTCPNFDVEKEIRSQM